MLDKQLDQIPVASGIFGHSKATIQAKSGRPSYLSVVVLHDNVTCKACITIVFEAFPSTFYR